jgi:hypothetical protein
MLNAPAAELAGVIVFLLWLVSLAYTWSCYERYRSSWRQGEPVGLISRVRASFQLVHNPADVSDDSRLAFARLKTAALINVTIMLSLVAGVLTFRILGFLAED